MIELYLGFILGIILLVAMGIFGYIATIDLIEYKNKK